MLGNIDDGETHHPVVRDVALNTWTELPAGATGLAVNEQQWVVGREGKWEDPDEPMNPNDPDGPKGRGHLGFLWDSENGLRTFHDVLPEKFQRQLRSAVPFLITNAGSEGDFPTITFSAESLAGDGSWVAGHFTLGYDASGDEYVVREIDTLVEDYVPQVPPAGEPPTAPKTLVPSATNTHGALVGVRDGKTNLGTCVELLADRFQDGSWTRKDTGKIEQMRMPAWPYSIVEKLVEDQEHLPRRSLWTQITGSTPPISF